MLIACHSLESKAAVSGSVADALRARAASQGEVRLIVQFEAPGQGFAELPAAARAAREQQIATLQENLANRLRQPGLREIKRFRTIPFMVFSADAAAVDRLAQHPQVIHMKEDSLDYPTLASSIPVIGATAAWAKGYDGAGQVIAVLDTGVDTTHPYFPPGKVVAEACFSSGGVGGNQSLCPDKSATSTIPGSGNNCTAGIESCRHGTHVAGIAAGNSSTGSNIGVAKGAHLIPIQVFSCIFGGCNSSGSIGSYESDQISALEHVLALSASQTIAAVNLSLGGAIHTSQATCDANNPGRKAAIDNLRAVGIPTIIASGNDNSKNGIRQPGCISSAISVGNTTDDDLIYDDRLGSNVASFLTLLAPGTSIESAVPGGDEVFYSGTSMSTPHVAGAWAVIRQADHSASIDDILLLLRDTATLVDDQRSGGTVTGMHRINLGAAISAFEQAFPEVETLPIAGSELDFGSVLINQQSDAQLISLSNTGSGYLDLSCTIVGDQAANFSILQCPAGVAPAGETELHLLCHPEMPGALTAQLQVSTNDEDEELLSFELQCQAGPSDGVFSDSFEQAEP